MTTVALALAMAPGCKCGNPDTMVGTTGMTTGPECEPEEGQDECPCHACGEEVDGQQCKCFFGPMLEWTALYEICDTVEGAATLEDTRAACATANNVAVENLGSLFVCTPAVYCEPDVPTTGVPSECEYWDPAASIHEVANVYSVNASLISYLGNNPALIGLCEVFFTELVEGGFLVQGLDPGEVLYELGLRSGDRPVELNGMPLATYEDLVTANMELWLDQSETEYELELMRGSTPVALTYTVYFTH